MHPYIVRAIAAQQAAEWQADAQAHLRNKLARQTRKAQRHHSSVPDPLADLWIPDYVDEMFPQETATSTASRRARKPRRVPLRRAFWRGCGTVFHRHGPLSRGMSVLLIAAEVLPGKIKAQGWALAPIALATRP